MCDSDTFQNIRRAVDGQKLPELDLTPWRSVLEAHAKAHDEKTHVERMARTRYVDVVLVSAVCKKPQECPVVKDHVEYPGFRGFYVRVDGKMAGLECYERM